MVIIETAGARLSQGIAVPQAMYSFEPCALHALVLRCVASVRPVRLLRVWISEGLTQADS